MIEGGGGGVGVDSERDDWIGYWESLVVLFGFV